MPPDLCLLGCIFLFTGYENELDLQNWQSVVRRNGGEVEETYIHRITHIVCETQKSPVVQQVNNRKFLLLFWGQT